MSITFEQVMEEIGIMTKLGVRPRCIVIGRDDYDDIRMKASLVASVKNVPKVDKIGGVPLWIVPGCGYLILTDEAYQHALDNSRQFLS